MRGWANLGNSYYWAEDHAGARDAWQRAIELAQARLQITPNASTPLRHLAVAYAKLEQHQQALDVIDHLLTLERQDARTFVAIGKTYEILGDHDQALHYIEQALEHGFSPQTLEASAWLDELRTDPRYQALLTPDEETTPAPD